MLWVAWFVYCVPVVPTWCFVYLGLRPNRSALTSWAIASALALLWPPYLWQFKRWQRRHTWVDQLERELHAH